MPIKDPRDFFVQAPKILAVIEGKLPAGAPKISEKLVQAAGKLPNLPDFPMDIPDLPDIKLPELGGARLGLGRTSTGRGVRERMPAGGNGRGVPGRAPGFVFE